MGLAKTLAKSRKRKEVKCLPYSFFAHAVCCLDGEIGAREVK